MNDNKLIFSLVIGLIILFGVFMMLNGGDEEPVTVIVSDEPRAVQLPEPVRPPPIAEEVEEEVTVEAVEEQPEVIAEEAPEEVIPEPEVDPLPGLNDSDGFVREELAGMDGGSAVLMHLVSDELIRKFVVLVENMSRGEFPDRNLPLTAPQQTMQVTELGSEFYLMDEASYRRFDSLVSAFTNIDTETAVSLYKELLPLFQQAYAELGIPNSEFNDVFMGTIDTVLNARSAAQPQQLIRPSLNFLYADPQIESYTDVEKLLLRLGPGNTENLKRRLEFFKRRLELEI